MSFTDMFKTADFKKKIVDLENANNELTTQNKKLEDTANIKLSLKQLEPEKLDQLISDKKVSIGKLENNITAKKREMDIAAKELEALNQQRENIRAEINDLSPDLEMSEYGLYRPQYDFANSLGYKDALKELRNQQKYVIKSKEAVTFNPDWTVNNSAAAGRKMNRNNIKAIFRSFNNECTDAIAKVTYSNFDRIDTRIQRSFDQHNKMYEVVQVQMLPEYLELKRKELHLAFEYRQKVQKEKDQLREERAREKEEKALQREIAAQRKSINKEIDHYSNAIDELNQRQISEPDNSGLESEIAKLRDKLAEYQNKKDAVDYREQNATAGYVYIISNIGSFGKNVFKIGVTRRLEPMDRINELGSASVPFKFDVHALIFSEDAYKLEAKLHEKFSDERINKVNMRKEYFNISIDEVEKELQNYKNVTVDFNETPDAEEYRETLAIEKSTD